MQDKTLFSADKITKQYSGMTALNAVSLTINRGEILGLIGENGAGKSTLLRIIAGVEAPTSGIMEMRGKPYKCRNPLHANEQGVGMVFQEQSLIKNLTVGQNIFLGREKEYSRFGVVNWKKMYADAKQIVGMEKIAPEKKIDSLDFATRQMVEIGKVLHRVGESAHQGSLILLDEPTSVLNGEEIEKLFAEMRKLKEHGDAVVFVSHRLDEVLTISDRVYVFRDGENLGDMDAASASEKELQEKMVGRSTTGAYFKTERQTVPSDDQVLAVRNLGKRGRFKGVDFTLRRGEVLGICGVVGSGKEELCAVINGDENHNEGELLVCGKTMEFKSPSDALRQGIISVPKERREEGILGIRSIYENISIGNFNKVRQNGLVSKKKQVRLAEEWIAKLKIKCSSARAPLETLSGGNAQKVVFSRVTACAANVLVLNHPTRGVDVGAKEDIYSLVRDLSAKGIALIVLGDTLDECIGLSSKIIVMRDGVVTQTFDAPVGGKPEQVEIIRYMV